MGLLGSKELDYIRKKFKRELVDDVPMIYFTSDECQTCETVKQLLEDITSVSDEKLRLEIVHLTDLHKKILGVNRGPVIILGKHSEIRYTGGPLGEEAWAFLEGITLSSRRNHGLEKYEQDLTSLDRKVKIETIVTPTCPWCPHAALVAHRVAVASRGKVISDVVEAYEFPEIAERYNVSAVPTIILSVDGNYTGEVFTVGVPKLELLIRRILKLGIEE